MFNKQEIGIKKLTILRFIRKNLKIILDGYNANPSSMSSSIDSFVNQGFPNPLIIVGDMLELGESSKHYHNSILKKLAGETAIYGITHTLGRFINFLLV